MINLQQTVDLVRLSIEVVESNIDEILDPADAPEVHAAVLRYAREVAFATAEVYARAAEVRGAWDARLEALVVDAVLRSETDEAVLSRASALGWSAGGDVAVVARRRARRSAPRPTSSTRYAASPGPRAWTRCAPPRASAWSWCSAASRTPRKAAEAVVDLFGDGPVVVGPVAEDLSRAYVSARAALSAHRVRAGWPDAPATGAQRRPAARAGAGRRRPRPPAPGRRDLPAAAASAGAR